MLAFLPYGDDFLKQRKFFQRVFSHQGCLDFRPIQVSQTQTLLKNILRDPTRFADHARQ